MTEPTLAQRLKNAKTGGHVLSVNEKRALNALLDEAAQVLEFHPRAAKLMAKRKGFVLIAEDEPYFVDAYRTIRVREQEKGTWTQEDEKAFLIACFSD